jgi:hypothetical protein
MRVALVLGMFSSSVPPRLFSSVLSPRHDQSSTEIIEHQNSDLFGIPLKRWRRAA